MKKNIYEILYSDSKIVPLDIDELNKMLEDEMAKENPDTDLLDELTLAIIETENLSIKNTDIEKELCEIRNKTSSKPKIKVWKSALIAACAILLIGNVYTMTTFGDNLFSAAFQKGEQLIVDLAKIKNNKNTYNTDYLFAPMTTDKDPLGIKSLCSIFGAEPVSIPTWIPENLSYKEMIYSVSDSHFTINIVFYDKTDKKDSVNSEYLSVTYHFFDNNIALDDYITENNCMNPKGDTVLYINDSAMITSRIIEKLNQVSHSILIRENTVFMSISCGNLKEHEVRAVFDSIM